MNTNWLVWFQEYTKYSMNVNYSKLFVSYFYFMPLIIMNTDILYSVYIWRYAVYYSLIQWTTAYTVDIAM